MNIEETIESLIVLVAKELESFIENKEDALTVARDYISYIRDKESDALDSLLELTQNKDISEDEIELVLEQEASVQKCELLTEIIVKKSMFEQYFPLAYEIIMKTPLGFEIRLLPPCSVIDLQSMNILDQKVNKFFLTMLYSPFIDRTFESNKRDYQNLGVSFESIIRRQTVRLHNQQTLQQAQIANNNWNMIARFNKEKGPLSDFIIKAQVECFNRIFLAMIKGEEIKPNP